MDVRDSFKVKFIIAVLDKIPFSATIPVDVVGRSTVHVGDDFLLVGASDNGEKAPMLKWDSRNSEWIELEVRERKNK